MTNVVNKTTAGLTKRAAAMAIALIAPLGLTVAADASTVPLTSGNGTLVDNILTFEDDGTTISITSGIFEDVVSATGAQNGTSRVTQSSDGLGVAQAGDTQDGLDGTNGKDLLLLRFDELVTLETLTFTNVDVNDDFDLFVDTNGDGVPERVAFDIFINLESGTAPGTSVAQVALSNVIQATGTFFGIGADGFDDDFLLSALSFSTVGVSEVPIPGAIPLFLTGLAGMGFTRRRKKVAQA